MTKEELYRYDLVLRHVEESHFGKRLLAEVLRLRGLLKKALENLKPDDAGQQSALWSLVGEHCCVGSTLATRLCEELGLDPDKKVYNPYCCDRCEKEIEPETECFQNRLCEECNDCEM